MIPKVMGCNKYQAVIQFFKNIVAVGSGNNWSVGDDAGSFIMKQLWGIYKDWVLYISFKSITGKDLCNNLDNKLCFELGKKRGGITAVIC